ATAYAIGTVGDLASLDGVISTLDDVDYFSFTAGQSGTATLTASNMTHGMTAAWSTPGITGSVGGRHGETFTFDVVAGQTYTVGIASGSGIGYYDLDIAIDSGFTYTDWGAVSFAQLNGLAVDGEAWYRVVASQTGYLTVEG